MVGFPAKIREDEACAAVLNLPISRRKAVKICKKLRGKPVSEAKRILEEVKTGKCPIEGKTWPSTCEHFLQLLRLVKANAEEKGLSGLQIKSLVAERGGRRGQRRRRRRTERAFGRELKSTNLKVIVHGS